MKLTIRDRSTYFKGLLLLIKKDNRVSDGEDVIMTKIGETLGFEKLFIKGAIKELMENEFLTDDIPLFSDQSIAESFILDGLKVAFSDDEFSAEELEHLTKIANQNGIDKEWLMNLISNYIKYSETLNTNEFLFVTKYLDNSSKFNYEIENELEEVEDRNKNLD
jgi:hypothetical protein